MGINSITFNGVNSLDYGLYVSGDKTFNSAEKDYTKVSVPGRSGDLLLFNNRFKNVSLTYNAIVGGDYEKNTEGIRNWLLSPNGYCRLEDTYHPNEYRMACFVGPIEFETFLLEAGSTELVFDCKPQRWLKSGEEKISFVSGYTRNLMNPTMFLAKPIIRAYGKGRIQVGTGDIVINEAGLSYIDIDCDLQDCYEGNYNRNQNVTVNVWPTLTPGANKLIADFVDVEEFDPSKNGFSKIEIIPRWWIL